MKLQKLNTKKHEIVCPKNNKLLRKLISIDSYRYKKRNKLLPYVQNKELISYQSDELKHHLDNFKLDIDKLDFTIKCTQCQLTTKVLRWTCTCHKYWHRCTMHIQRQRLYKDSPDIIHKQQKSKHSNQTQRDGQWAKRHKANMSHRELVAYDLKREDREAERQIKRKAPLDDKITLKKSCLSKGLRERFAHLLVNQ